MNDTVFGKIMRGEIPCTKVYEDEKCFAMLDINPVTKGHTVLFPKEQYVWMQDAPDEVISYVFITAKKIALAMKKSLHCDYVEIVVEGKEVPHFHVHLMPSHIDTPTAHWDHTTYDDGEALEYAQKISTHM